jgi:hypothetical protein
MLSRFAKTLLALTSLAPVLAAMGVSIWSTTGSLQKALPWLVSVVGLVVICWGLLRYAETKLPREQKGLASVNPADKEVLAFLVAYLLPLVAQRTTGFAGDWVTGAFIFVLLVIVIYHGNAYTFNPLLSMLGFHFYTCRDKASLPMLLISRRDFVPPDTGMQVARLAPYIFVEIGSSDG